MSADAPRPQPLAGVTVVDLTQIYNGPYATYLMALAGAEVIKVEPPGGEHLRRRGASLSALPFAMLNGNKRSVCLDLKRPQARELLLRLVEQADVLVENFAPGALERLGLGWDVLVRRNPRLVLASGSGYGSDGPYRDYPAMDLTVQAITGVMSTTGTPDSPPLKAGPAICDFFGGIHLYAALATALFERERTGIGRAVEVSMMEAVYASLTSSLGMLHAFGDRVPMRTGNRHSGLALCPYNLYPASDGHIAIICTNEQHWRTLVRLMERPELLDDPRCKDIHERARHMDSIDALVGAWTARHPKEDLFRTLGGAHVPCAPVRTLEEVVADPHLHARRMLEEIEHPQFGPLTVSRSPLRFRGSELVPLEPSRPLGADNEAVLGRLGLAASDMSALREAGVLG